MKLQPEVLKKTAQAYFKPDPKFTRGRSYELDQQFLAFLVGCVAIGLPLVMLLGWRLGACFYDSLSHFYYAQFFGDIFVAALVFIGTFLVAYRGESKRESLFATIAGICAFGIALFPTSGRGCEKQEFSGRILANLQSTSPDGPVELAENPGAFFELFPYSDILHFGSATLLFLFLSFYSFVIFTRIDDKQHRTRKGGPLTSVKRTRNSFYVVSGWIIVVCILAIAANALNSYFGTMWVWWNEYNLTFVFEALALCAFGLSWLVKGRFWGYLLLDPQDRKMRAKR